MENNINLKELFLRQLDLSLNMKSAVETKATGYLMVDTLIIGILLDFIKEMYQKDICPLFKNTCISYFALLFIIGLIVLVLCAVILFPKSIAHLNYEEILQLCKLKKDAEIESDAFLIEEMEGVMRTNTETVQKLDKLNKFSSIGMMILVIGFVLSCLLFFIFIGAML